MGSLLLALEGLFLGVFIVRAAVGRPAPPERGAPRARETRTAPGARALLAFHGVGIVLVSLGIAATFRSERGRFPVSARVVLGLAILLAASVLAGWALRVFTSWRLLARLDAGHALCEDGPYRHVEPSPGPPRTSVATDEGAV
jgi:protein-S-isoprenylcysteine O-methyltransferase Ste14